MAFKLGAILSKANLKEAGLAAAGGGAAGLAYDLLTDLDMTDAAGAKVPVFDKAWKKGALAAGLAVVGGGLAWNKSKPLAHGVVGAMGAEITRHIVTAIRGAVAGAATAGVGSPGELAALAESRILEPQRVGGATLAGNPDMIRSRAVLSAVG